MAPRQPRSTPARTPQDGTESWLQAAIIIFGAAQLIFFVPIIIILPFRIALPPALESLMRWGPGGAEQYEEMIAVIYIIWGFYTLRAAKDPFENTLFLDFTVYGNVGHISLMTAMAVVNKKDRVHLIGDVLAAWLVLGPLVYAWTRAKHGRRAELLRR